MRISTPASYPPAAICTACPWHACAGSARGSWSQLGGATPAISPAWIRQIGIRSVDAGEKRFVHEQGLEVFDMRSVDELGVRQVMDLALADMDANTHLHVSFDVDFLDPEIAPGVGTTVPGGPSYREAQLCMEMIADTGRHGIARCSRAQSGAGCAQQDRHAGRGPDRIPVRQRAP